MNIIQAIFLGIIQGITEFLPISSSAHLVIFPYLLGWRIPNDQNFSFDVLVQLGTLLSLIIYFRRDLWQIILAVLQGIKTKTPFQDENSRLGWLVILATIPAGLAGILLKSKVEVAFGSPTLTAFFLFGTAFLLIIAEVIGKRSRILTELTWKNAIVVGLFQAISIFPGISRSGACLAGGMVQNYHRKDAARFSFLLAIPIMMAAGLLGMIDLLKVKGLVQFLPMLMAGFIVSAIVGYFFIHWMLNYLNKHSLFIFAGYCILLGLLVLGFSLWSPQKPAISPLNSNSPTILVNHPSSLSWMTPIINDCNQKSFALPLKFEEQPIQAHFTSSTINLGFEKTDDPDATTFLIGYEPLNIAASKNNPLVQLSSTQLEAIFEGTYTTWADFIKECDQCPNKNAFSSLTDKRIQLWVYPYSNYEQKIFSQEILNNVPSSLSANIAPDAKAMAEALQFNPAALGFLPLHWINNSLRAIKITNLKVEDIKVPVLANVPLLPVKTYEELLLCIQNSIINN